MPLSPSSSPSAANTLGYRARAHRRIRRALPAAAVCPALRSATQNRSPGIVTIYGDRTRRPLRYRAFNRFELKYLIGRDQIEAVRDDLSDNLQPDPHSPDGSYAVWSLYYDTPTRKFYWEKIDGVPFRRKLRIRHYGEPELSCRRHAVFVEIKQRVNRVTQKRRIAVPYREALRALRRPTSLRDAGRDRPSASSTRF